MLKYYLRLSLGLPLDSITLREIWNYGDDTLLVLLITLARQVGLEKVAEVHMQPLL